MAHCAFLLAIVLPFVVAAAHIIGTGQLPISSSLRRQPVTFSSPRRQPPGTRAVSSSSFELGHQPADRGDMPLPSFFKDRHQLPEPAVLEDLIKRGSEAKDMVEKSEHLGKVLRLFGYNRMADAAPHLANARMLALWSGPITVFAVPDADLLDACPSPSCSLRFLVLKHLAIGSYSFSKLSSRRSFKLITPAINFCMSTTTTVLSSGGGLSNIVSINSVDITRPELYNDGHFVIHGVKSVIQLPPQGSCTSDGKFVTMAEVSKLLHDTFARNVF